MNNKKYKHSFARKLTRWVMLVLFIMMGAMAFLIYVLTKSIVVEDGASIFHGSMQTIELSIDDAMSDVSVAVKNNIFEVERCVRQPDQLRTISRRKDARYAHTPGVTTACRWKGK